MRVIVATCDKYDHLLLGFAHQFNKYWGAHQDVVVLGFRQPPDPLPQNFSFHSMDPVETKAWTANLRSYFLQQADTHFVWLLDDYWLVKPINHAMVRKVEDQVIRGAVKGDLSLNTQHFKHSVEGDWLVADTEAQYRTSTQPAIWRRRYLLSLLQKDLNPWEYELQNSPRLTKRGRIVGTRQQIFDYANVYYKGAPHHMINLISAEDKAELMAIGAFKGFDPQPQL